MLRTFLLCLVSSAITCGYTQNEKLPLFKINGSQFGIRNTLSPGIDYTLPDLRELLPNSTLLIQDMSDFNQSSPSINADNVDVEYLLKFKIRNNKGNYGNGRLRLGLSLGYSYDFSGFLNQSENINLDSFSTAQHQTVSIDSFHSRRYSVQHSSNQFNIHCSYIINANPNQK